ncbi:hypothetical protein [Halorussus sp. AFM4]|uniref:hypothetical protein n=1 Tax=Halorussus sp. AFM4 TaxID=3421651 RepID=UPI003EB6A9FA
MEGLIDFSRYLGGRLILSFVLLAVLVEFWSQLGGPFSPLRLLLVALVLPGPELIAASAKVVLDEVI